MKVKQIFDDHTSLLFGQIEKDDHIRFLNKWEIVTSINGDISGFKFEGTKTHAKELFDPEYWLLSSYGDYVQLNQLFEVTCAKSGTKKQRKIEIDRYTLTNSGIEETHINSTKKEGSYL